MTQSLSLDDILAKLTALPEAEQKAIKKAAAQATKGRKWIPNPGAQTEAYFCPADEMFYGGEAGGGKTDLLVGLATEEHTISRIFRRQHNDRQALIERMAEILGSRDGYNGSDHIWRIPGTDRVVRFGAMRDDGRDRAVAIHAGPIIAQKLRLADALLDGEPHAFIRRLARARPRGAALLALAFHGRVEAVRVHFQAAPAQDVLREIEREAERVVELERRCARELLALLQRSEFVFEQLQSIAERAAEAFFFL